MKARIGFLIWLFLMAGSTELIGYGPKDSKSEKREAIPLNRLIRTFTDLHEANPKNVEPIYWLARLHALAYATNPPFVMVGLESRLPDLRVDGWDALIPGKPLPNRPSAVDPETREHLKQSIVLYERAAELIRTSTADSKRTDLVFPIQLGRAWCLHQIGRTNAAIMGYRKVLEAAWETEVVQLRKEEEQLLKNLQLGIYVFHCRPLDVGPGYSGAVIGYLLELLDPIQDAAEVRKLKEHLETFQKISRSPVR